MLNFQNAMALARTPLGIQRNRFGNAHMQAPLDFTYEGSYRRPILFNTDLDRTLLSWKMWDKAIHEAPFEGIQAVLNKHRQSIVTLVNTGRGLTALKSVAGFLAKLPIDLLSLNNGQELYWNWLHKPTKAWIEGLEHEYQDSTWKKCVNQRKEVSWNLPVVMDLVEKTLKTAGLRLNAFNANKLSREYYRKLPLLSRWDVKARHAWSSWRASVQPEKTPLSAGTVAAEFFPDQAQILFKLPAGKFGWLQKRFVKGLSQQIIRALHQKDIHVVWQLQGEAAEISLLLAPADPNATPQTAIHKASVIPYLLKKLPTLQAVISAGDGLVDLPILLPHRYTFTDRSYRPKNIPNYPILSGDRPALKVALVNHPRLQTASEAGNLAEALTYQLAQCQENLTPMDKLP